MGEADNESHGTEAQYLKDSSWENASRRWNERIADNPELIFGNSRPHKTLRTSGRKTALAWSFGRWEMSALMDVPLRRH